MPDIKIMKSEFEKNLMYKCFLLNVRSHRDYVCLEIDSCPSNMDFSTGNEFSLDSSTVIMPVLDKIRFNIKCANSAMSLWYKSKLEVFAEGNQIFPRKYCLKCEARINEEADTFKSDNINRGKPRRKTVLIKTDENEKTLDKSSEFGTPCCSDPSLNYYVTSNAKNKENKSSLNTSLKDVVSKINLKCRSEMLTVDQEYSNVEATCLSLPDVFNLKDNAEKSIQTCVSLGNEDFSNISLESDVTVVTLKDRSNDDLFKNKTFKVNSEGLQDDSNFIHSTVERFKSFDVNKKIRYWSLIKSARQMIKMNKDVLELNTMLKSLAVENSLENLNLLDSFSPVNLILKLKKLNRSSSLYSIINENTDRIDSKSISNQLFNLTLTENDLNQFNYFLKLSRTLSDEDTKNKSYEGDNDKSSKGSSSKESLLSMSTLYSVQKRMLLMMESFLKKSSIETSEKTITSEGDRE